MTEGPTLRELEKLLHQVIGLTRTDQPLFLNREWGGTSLPEQVQRESEAESERSGIVNQETSGHAESMGRWKVTEPIGAGGLGVVYRASCEADGVTLQAAVKILRPELNPIMRERFIEERSMLAGLDHP